MKYKLNGNMTLLTREQTETALDNGKLFALTENGNYWQMRRNGATKKWKRAPNRFYLPFKCGFKAYGSITETDFHSTGHLLPHFYRHITDLTGV